MEAEWMAKRATLRWLLHTHPEWTRDAVCGFSALFGGLGEKVEKAARGGRPR
jgi:hypothetical protein